MIREKLSQVDLPFFMRQGFLVAVGIVAFVIVAGVGTTYYAVSQKPELGAQVVDVLRDVVGDEAVAQLEEIVFNVQDFSKQMQFRLTGKEPNAPWKSAAIPTPVVVAPTATPEIVTTVQPSAAVATPRPVLTAVAGVSWPPPNLHRIGVLDEEGVWTPYIYDTTGRVAAYRTFLQPDKERPYAVTAVVVFNLGISRLGFVLGSEEPISTNTKVYRPGGIPLADKQPGVLLATFNGGFKAQHGQYGTFYEGNIMLSGRPGMSTLLLYRDGKVDLQDWDSKFYDAKEIRSWRQNGPFLVRNGEINPETNDKNKLLENWGATIDGNTVTWRSGIGLSKNRQFLYYVAGPSLTVATLATVLKTSGAQDAMQLDINPYWVHFTSITAVKNQLKAEPLFPEMQNNEDRYLYNYTRDYFYITANSPEP